jgi:hypothetical protein
MRRQRFARTVNDAFGSASSAVFCKCNNFRFENNQTSHMVHWALHHFERHLFQHIDRNYVWTWSCKPLCNTEASRPIRTNENRSFDEHCLNKLTISLRILTSGMASNNQLLALRAPWSFLVTSLSYFRTASIQAAGVSETTVGVYGLQFKP